MADEELSVAVPEKATEVPDATVKLEEGVVMLAETVLEAEGLKMMSMTGWSSMPFGATPVWPWRKSNMPMPVMRTGTFAVWKEEVAV